MYVNVYVGDAFVDCVKALDTVGDGLVDEKSDSSCIKVMARASENMEVWFGGPELAGVRAPRLVDGKNMPLCVL